MLIQTLVPEIVLPACDYSSESASIIGRVKEDLSPVLPYLNATQSKASYQKAGNILRFRFEGRIVALQPHEIALEGFEDGDQAVATLFRLQNLINDTWERRKEITPSFLERKRLQALAVYKLLPGSNCKECGEPNCFVFANKLAAGLVVVELCTPLCRDTAHVKEKNRLMTMLAES